MGLMGLLMANYAGLKGILDGLTKSTDHPSRGPKHHINKRILQTLFFGIPLVLGLRARMQDPCVDVVFCAPVFWGSK